MGKKHMGMRSGMPFLVKRVKIVQLIVLLQAITNNRPDYTGSQSHHASLRTGFRPRKAQCQQLGNIVLHKEY
jgi:hypothetical protein